MIDAKNVLTDEEGYELTKTYTKYFWDTNKFYSLKNAYELDDVISEIMLKFIRLGFFQKYNPEVTSKKYFVMNGVRTSMIDLLRKYRDVVSLSREIGDEGLTMMDVIEDESLDIESSVSGKIDRNYLLNLIPDETRSTLIGHSPIMGEVRFTYRVFAIHLEQGYSIKEIASMFINPKSGRPVSESRVSQLIKEMRQYIIENIEL